MKCPKCKEEIADDVKFCTKCGANIESENAKKIEQERKKAEKEAKKKKALEDKKKLEEIRKQEQLKQEEKIKEAEKAEAIRQAKEQGIELEIIDKKEENKQSEYNEQTKSNQEFKIKETKPKKEKKKKVKIKKNIFQRIINKLIFMIVTALIIIGAVCYCYTQKLLPDFVQNEIQDFDNKLHNVINSSKELKEGSKNLPQTKEDEWKVEPNIEAEDIKDLTKDVSVIVKDGKEGLINNETGEIILEPKYSQIFNSEYYDIGKTEAEKTSGIVVKDIEKFYKVDSEYKITTEVVTIPNTDEGSYFYDHHGADVYFNNSLGVATKAEKSKDKKLEVCIDIDLVTTEGISAKDEDLPKTFSIDFSKSTIFTKGYYDTKKGELVINCDYDEAYDFSEGYAAVKTGSKAGIIDESGNKIIELKYDETRSVHNGVAFVKKNGKWGIMKVK